MVQQSSRRLLWHLVVTEMQGKNNTLFGLLPLLGLLNRFGPNRPALQASGLFYFGGGRGGGEGEGGRGRRGRGGRRGG